VQQEQRVQQVQQRLAQVLQRMTEQSVQAERRQSWQVRPGSVQVLEPGLGLGSVQRPARLQEPRLVLQEQVQLHPNRHR
jgi:hypothetical protein